MKINIPRVRKLWAISFWMLLSWSLTTICFDASRAGIHGINALFGELIGTGMVMGIIYTCAYKRTGVRSLVYLMTITSLSVFGDLALKDNYDVISIILKTFIWFTSYRLLLANAVLECKATSENKAAKTCDIT